MLLARFINVYQTWQLIPSKCKDNMCVAKMRNTLADVFMCQFSLILRAKPAVLGRKVLLKTRARHKGVNAPAVCNVPTDILSLQSPPLRQFTLEISTEVHGDRQKKKFILKLRKICKSSQFLLLRQNVH